MLGLIARKVAVGRMEELEGQALIEKHLLGTFFLFFLIVVMKMEQILVIKMV